MQNAQLPPYNTKSTPLILKAYGREVERMVEAAMAIEDRAERTAYAARIIEVMRIVTQQERPTAEVMAKLWNHLAQLSAYRLDIDYPYPIERHAEATRPPRLSYPNHRIRLRHYGHFLETLVARILAEQDPQERAQLICLAAARMKRNLAEMRGDVADVRRVARDLDFFTDGALSIEEVTAALTR